MALYMLSVFLFYFLISVCFTAPPLTNVENIDDSDSSFEVSTTSPIFSLTDFNPWWESDENEYDIYAKTWPKDSPFSNYPPVTSDEDDDNSEKEDINSENGLVDKYKNVYVDNDDEEDQINSLPSKQNESKQDSEYLLPDDEDKRDSIDQLKVRHTGRNASPSSTFIDNNHVPDYEDEEEYENNGDDDDIPVPDNDGPDYLTDDENDDVFEDESKLESKRLLEDKVFLF